MGDRRADTIVQTAPGKLEPRSPADPRDERRELVVANRRLRGLESNVDPYAGTVPVCWPSDEQGETAVGQAALDTDALLDDRLSVATRGRAITR
jgi:hypothetical protein